MNPRHLGWALSCTLLGCGTIPEARYESFEFPNKNAFITAVKRPFQPLGWVKAKVNFQSFDPNREESALCKNYYNKAVRQLVQAALSKGADAVVDVKSVVFLEDGRQETYPTAECSDDGFEGQILLQGVAVKWKKEQKPQDTHNAHDAHGLENSSIIQTGLSTPDPVSAAR